MFAATTTQSQKSTSWMNKVVSRFTQKAAALPTLSQAMAGRAIAETTYQGICQVPLSQIKGTASDGRSRDFDANFRLTKSHSNGRLHSVRQARQQLAALPPISLVRVGSSYYVQDGHHRVSVFRDCEQDVITAHVTVLVLQ
ncbi:MAG: hypothetical protein WAS33_29090 [Candidatus Promineifilaceae bacterium]|nr:hypothetical protein [Anaerolineaceae bacterium]